MFLDSDGLALLDGVRTVVKSPGTTREVPATAAAPAPEAAAGAIVEGLK